MRLIRTLLFVIGIVYATSVCAVGVVVDSLVAIESSQDGLTRLQTLYRIAENSDSNFGRRIEYSLNGVLYGKQLLEDNSLPTQQRDSIISLVIKHYKLLAYGYYASDYSNPQLPESKRKETSQKILDYIKDVRRLEGLYSNIDSISSIDPHVLIVADQSAYMAYLLVEDYEKAEVCADRMVSLMHEKGTPYLEAVALQNKANVYLMQLQFDRSIDTMERGLAVLVNDSSYQATSLRAVFYQNYSVIYGQSQQLGKCEKYALMCKDLAESLGEGGYEALAFVYETLDEVYRLRNDYKLAYEYRTLCNNYRDSIFNKEYAQSISELEAKYNYAESQAEINSLKQKTKIRYWQMNAMMIFIILLVIGIIYINRTARLTRRQNSIIDQQRSSLEESLKDTNKSIEYASLLQQKIMNTGLELYDKRDDMFVIQKPKESVGGDFFHVYPAEDYTLIAVADCTGHGVPAALLSVMCLSLLNEVLQNTKGIPVAHEVLEALREGIKNTLNEESTEMVAFSGMDMSLVVIQEDNKTLQFAGANRPLFLVRDGILYEYKPVRNPLAKYYNERPFESQDIEYENGDMLYMFTDGITDQFSEAESQKFGFSRLRKLLVSVFDLPVNEQKKVIDEAIVKHKGSAPQTDDALLLAKRM